MTAKAMEVVVVATTAAELLPTRAMTERALGLVAIAARRDFSGFSRP
jgi:hypothetical protein